MKNNYSKKLTWKEVEAIRKSFKNPEVLAKRFGVSRVTIHCIVNYKTWKVRKPMTAEERYIKKLEDENKNLKELLKLEGS